MGTPSSGTKISKLGGHNIMADAIRTSKPAARLLISAVLASSVVLVCRPQHAEQEGFYDDVVRALEDRIARRLEL